MIKYDTELIINKLNERILKTRVAYLKTLTFHPQGSPEWLQDRLNFITASEASSVVGMSKYTSRQELLINKCGLNPVPFTGNKYSLHGQKYEPIARDIYMATYLVPITEFGLIKHATLPLGASPDGIRDDGIMVEIKVPMMRKITGIIPPEYWVQQQIQMEVCDLNENDFYELDVREYDYKEEYYYDVGANCRLTKGGKPKGMIAELNNKMVNNSKIEYLYPPYDLTSAGQEDWIKEQVKLLPPNKSFKTNLYWRAETISCVRTHRDRKWMQDNIPLFLQFWQEVLNHRKTDFIELKEQINKKIEIKEVKDNNKLIKTNIKNIDYIDDNEIEDEFNGIKAVKKNKKVYLFGD